MLALSGLFAGGSAGSLLATRDKEAPPEAHTQVFSMGAGFKLAAGALGAAIAGQMAGVGPDALLLRVAACHAIGAVVGIALLPAERRPKLIVKPV